MDAFINVNKEKGFTSADVVAVMRGILHERRIGHTGTLDPDACGVLPLCVGKATVLSELVMGQDKEYVCALAFGYETDTQDASGSVTASAPYVFDEAVARDAILSFIGDYEQLPPMYSALKVDGRHLYDLARQGREVERKARPVRISEIEILELSETGARLRVNCSKGTYIRTLCEDIGRKCGYLATMTELTRTRTGAFALADALTLSEIEARVKAGDLSFAKPMESALVDYKALTVPAVDDGYLLNGNYLTYSREQLGQDFAEDELVRMLSSAGRLIGLHRVHILEEGVYRFRAYKMLGGR